MRMTFQDKTAIVTGGARGIGRAICLELARRGCNIAFNYSRSMEQAQQLADEVASLGRKVSSHQVNAADSAAVESMVKEVREKLGRIDYLVNNAGIIRDKLLLRMSESDWDEVIDINLKGAFNFSRAVAGIMLRARSGSILNITSISGIVGMVGQANYSASKAGLIGLTKALAKEMAGRNVTVNALALGLIETDMTRALPEEYRKAALNSIPLKRFGTAEEVAKLAGFLLSDDAGYITGQVIQADGGMAI
jgi:3-oxoacyl-[acyl-carrier protein] reductase